MIIKGSGGVFPGCIRSKYKGFCLNVDFWLMRKGFSFFMLYVKIAPCPRAIGAYSCSFLLIRSYTSSAELEFCSCSLNLSSSISLLIRASAWICGPVLSVGEARSTMIDTGFWSMLSNSRGFLAIPIAITSSLTPLHLP